VINDDDLSVDSETELSKEEIEHRVHDWLDRLRDLFQKTEHWAASQGWNADSSDTVEMNEEPMKRRGVPAQKQPTLRLESPGGGYALFKPKGLWVIGANGRIDLYTPKGAFIIVDQAEQFSTPRWRLFRADKRPEGTPYTPDVIPGLI